MMKKWIKYVCLHDQILTIYKLEDVLNETESAFFNVMIQHNKTIKDGDCSIAMKLTASTNKINKTNKTQKYFKYLIDTSNKYIYSTYTQYI